LALVGSDDDRYDPPQRVGREEGLSKMSKVKITAWVDERTASAIKGLAAQHGVSVSEIGARLLRRGVEEDAGGGVGAEILLPAVRGAVRREVGRMSDRLAQLMGRSALESATGRRLLFQLLAEEMGQEEANRRNRAAWTASVQSVKKPAEGLREILGEAPVDAASADGEGTAR
jgi:hypothetical protein